MFCSLVFLQSSGIVTPSTYFFHQYLFLVSLPFLCAGSHTISLPAPELLDMLANCLLLDS